MQKIESFNKQNLKEVRELLDQKLAELTKETGIDFDFNSITFNEGEFSCKLKASIPGKAEDRVELINSMSPIKDLIGKTFTVNGKTLTVERYDSKKRKYPIICSSGSAEYKLSLGQVTKYIEG